MKFYILILSIFWTNHQCINEHKNFVQYFEKVLFPALNTSQFNIRSNPVNASAKSLTLEVLVFTWNTKSLIFRQNILERIHSH